MTSAISASEARPGLRSAGTARQNKNTLELILTGKVRVGKPELE